MVEFPDLLPDNLPAINSLCQSLGWLLPDETILGLSPAGEGNMNRTLRAETGSRTFILKQSVPYVARYPQIAAPEERIVVEDRFYQTIEADGPLRMRMPHRLGFAPQSRLLMLEDVGPGADMLSVYANAGGNPADRGVYTALIYWLWRLHSLRDFNAAYFTNDAMRTLNHAHIFVIPLQTNNGAAIDPALAEIAQRFQNDSQLISVAGALGEIYLGRTPHASHPCLLHGDFYPGSWLRNERLGVMIIDPEFAFCGPPEFDVGVLVAHLTFAGFAQQDIMGILRSYVTPPGFEYSLAIRFAAIEIIRRLLGVAQLPLQATSEQKRSWLETARMMINS
jgi:5-methylthioribose kinase